jgi:Penicillin binding protein transpeptidase domain/NTF2-like N-terminal transpeptidase domain
VGSDERGDAGWVPGFGPGPGQQQPGWAGPPAGPQVGPPAGPPAGPQVGPQVGPGGQSRAGANAPQLMPDGTYGWVDPGHEPQRPDFPDVAPPAGARSRLLDAEPPPPRKGRRWWIAAAVVVLLAAAAAGAAFGIPEVGVALGLRPSPRELATTAGTSFLTDWQGNNYAGMQALVADKTDDMNRVYGGMAQRLHITKVVAHPGKLDAVGTAMPYDATVTLQGLGDVTWSSTVHLVEQSGVWKVKFTADTVYPGLGNAQRLELETAPGQRGDVVDRNGKPLSGDPDLAVNVLGTVKNGAGATGLERAFNDKLAGRSSTRLQIVDVSLKQTLQVVQQWQAQAGQTVTTTFDLDMQRKAEQALAGVKVKAALVAIDTKTGEVRAMASHPTAGLATAFAGGYAPGSTFKIVTATAALMNGMTPSSTVECPTKLTVDGRTFQNAEKAPDSKPTLTQAFAESCNTAFMNVGLSLPAGALQKAAELYGFNATTPPLPISSVGGQAPAPAGKTELAADAIGQGKVEASPLQLASVAAGVASGTWHQPHLIADCPDCKSNPIPVAASLQPLMRAVVTSGTGTAAAGVKGGPVYAKTGTAEFGTGNPPQTHAWFVGWQNDLAFAVYVDEGAFGGTVAAPIAASFLNSLP